MSIIDNLLVLLDDKKSRSIDEIKSDFNSYSKQVIASSLGRISTKKWITQSLSKKYEITNLGIEKNTIQLNNLLKLEERDNVTNCKFLILNIPEKERINRDIMRIYLQNNGFGRLHNTTWVNLHCDEKNLLKTLKELGIENKTLHFNINVDNNNIDKIINYSSWNYKIINNEYDKFIENVKNYIKNKETNKVTARCLVYEYSKIVQKDPIVPNKFLPKNYLGKLANNFYIKIRDYCY